MNERGSRMHPSISRVLSFAVCDRIMKQKLLLDKSCCSVSAEEDRRIRRERISKPPVFLKSELGLIVEDRIATEKVQEEEGQRPQ